MRTLLAALLLTIAGAASADAPVPLLWKVEKDAGTVYLLGSFHMLKPSDYPLSPAIDAAFDDAEHVLFEVAPAEMTSPETAKLAQRYARSEDGRTLRQSISPETAAKLQAFLGSEAALAASDPFEPWFLSMNMTVMAMAQAGFDPSKGLDMHLMQRAAEADKPTAGLETVEDQFRALDATPLDEQDVMLADSLESLPELRERLEQLHDYWRTADVAGLEKMTRTEMHDKTPVAYTLLNVERNQRWLPKIEAMLSEQDDRLVVVGAMHLLGDDGLVRQLERKGFAVVRVMQ